MTHVRPTEVAKLLMDARKKIERPEDWGKHARPARTNFDSCCAAEAVEESDGAQANDVRREAFKCLRSAASLHEWGSITGWNDAETRTHAEVLATFDRAIQIALRTDIR